MLLTSSQISMGISSAIIFIFSTILFLSGYILQQQTVRDLQVIIKPTPEAQTSTSSASDTLAELSTTGELSRDSIQWDKVAYVQIVQQHAKVCASAIIFAQLARQKSKAKRILLYPQSWHDDEPATGAAASASTRTTLPTTKKNNAKTKNANTSHSAKQHASSMPFLRKIAARYNVLLRPMNAAIDAHSAEHIVPLNRLYLLTELQALIYLSPVGMVYNASALDELFALNPMMGGGLHFLAAADAEIDADTKADARPAEPVAAMIKPSMATYQSLQRTYAAPLSLSDLVSAAGSTARTAATLFSDTSSLHHHHHQTPSAKPTSSLVAAYMHFSDALVPGPDYAIPRDLWRRARPVAEPARTVWQEVYAEYRAGRMDVCALDVQPLPAGERWVSGGGERLKNERGRMEHASVETAAAAAAAAESTAGAERGIDRGVDEGMMDKRSL